MAGTRDWLRKNGDVRNIRYNCCRLSANFLFKAIECFRAPRNANDLRSGRSQNDGRTPSEAGTGPGDASNPTC